MHRIVIGDCRAELAKLEAGSVNCIVTSPPYFGLRDYGAAGQIGLEQTPEGYLAELVAVFREARRVLRGDGTLWLNLGDSYSRSPGKGGSGPNGKNEQQWGCGAAQSSKVGNSDGACGRADRPGSRACDLEPKQLLGIPWRVAFALQADGWYLRQDIIWAKPNPMPESVTDRCTKAHEYLFLLSKSARYYFDHEAIEEPVTEKPRTEPRVTGAYSDLSGRKDSDRHRSGGFPKSSGNKARKPGSARGCPEGSGSNVNGSVPWEGDTRNKRSVWTVASRPFKEAHFATFPPELIEPAILAGCPPGGLVLDPFGGAGTTAIVADRLGRNSLLIEINPVYVEIAERRIAKDAGLFAGTDHAMLSSSGTAGNQADAMEATMPRMTVNKQFDGQWADKYPGAKVGDTIEIHDEDVQAVTSGGYVAPASDQPAAQVRDERDRSR